MGQGYSLTTLSAASASIDVPELADLVHDKTLGSARFMKSIRARHQQGFVFVKAVMKPYPSFQVEKYIKQIAKERERLADIPNALGYQRILEIGAGGFLARQYIQSSVYDRMSTRPFLEEIEKKWIVFQLLCAVRDCHARDVFHGDIKTENLLVTSWNWLYLADFSSSFKPTYLPEDNPADFSFYFDTSGRRTCYLAPERFTIDSNDDHESQVDWAMDIFSVGCVVAELFLEGPIFSLSQIFKYRSGDYSPEHTHLNRISDVEVRDMILHMIDLDPEKRYSAAEYLTFYKSKIFPDYFYNFLHQYMWDLTDPSAGRKPVTLDTANFGEADDKIDRIHSDLDKISFFLGYDKNDGRKSKQGNAPGRGKSLIPRSQATGNSDPKIGIRSRLNDGTLLFLTVVVSSLRNTARASARLKACDLLVLFAEKLPDEAKLDRILPYLVGLLSDSSDVVKSAALKSLTQLFDMVEVVSPINAIIFPVYIFPVLKEFVLSPDTNPSPMLRATYASSLGSLAQSSLRILDTTQAIKADGRLLALAENDWEQESTYHGLFDNSKADLVSYFEEATKSLMADPEPSVRRAFLRSVSSLCVFFGSSKASDVILSHLNTYLNDKEWVLRCSFFKVLVGVATYVGSPNLERFILPLMIQSLTDPENFVVEKVFRSFAQMAGIGLFQRTTTWELLIIAVRFLVHPSIWVREAAIHFVVLSTKYLSAADKFCIVRPMVQPFLRVPITEISEAQILESVKKPLPKPVLDMATLWATKVEKGLFWKAAIQDAVFILPDPESPNAPNSSKGRFPNRISSSQRNDEDEQWLNKLRGLGMTAEDDMKLLALREYIWRVAHRPSEGTTGSQSPDLNKVVSLNQINVTPQNVIFEKRLPNLETNELPWGTDKREEITEPHTIAEALLEASTTVEEQPLHGDDLPLVKETPNNGTATRPRAIRPRKQGPAFDISSVGSSPANQNRSDDQSLPGSETEVKKTTRTRSAADEFNDGASSLSHRDRFSIPKSSEVTLKHQNSAINLMKGKELSKANAATSMSSENAFGRLNGPSHLRRMNEASNLSAAVEASGNEVSNTWPRQTTRREYLANHSYAGTDANVLRLLDNHFSENYPVGKLFDLGPIKQPLDSKAPIRQANEAAPHSSNSSTSDQSSNHTEPWRPSGHLLTLFSEHTAAVNRVVAAPDHTFFVTASDDGTCKIWDTSRLEKNVTPRSRSTYRVSTGAKIKSLCFIEDTHTFVCGSDDGAIHGVKVEFTKIDGRDSMRFGKPVLVREHQLPRPTSIKPASIEGTAQSNNQEYAVWLQHYQSSNESTLLVLTNKSRIVALDIKTMDIIYSLENPLHHGTPTTICIDRRHYWLIVGTSHGILDMWDLRFRIRVKSWGLNSCKRIDRLIVHPTKGRGKWIITSCGGEVTVWDIEKVVCREVFRPDSFGTGFASKPGTTNTAAATSTKPYEPWFPDDEAAETILSRFASSISSKDPTLDFQQLVDPLPRPHTPPASNTVNNLANSGNPPPITALLLGIDSIYNNSKATEPIKVPFLLSGGADRVLRFWDLSRPEASTVISAPPGTGSSSSPGKYEGINSLKPRYEVSHPISGGGAAQLVLIEEWYPGRGGGASTPSTPASKRSGRGAPAGENQTASPSSNQNSTSSPKPPRNTIISETQQALLRSHLDSILDVCLLLKPYGLVVSADRGGGVYVFQ